MFKVGDRVSITDEYISHYEETKYSGDWCGNGEDLFRRGRVFLVKKVNILPSGKMVIILDDGIGGTWNEKLLRHADSLDNDLFII